MHSILIHSFLSLCIDAFFTMRPILSSHLPLIPVRGDNLMSALMLKPQKPPLGSSQSYRHLKWLLKTILIPKASISNRTGYVKRYILSWSNGRVFKQSRWMLFFYLMYGMIRTFHVLLSTPMLFLHPQPGQTSEQRESSTFSWKFLVSSR